VCIRRSGLRSAGLVAAVWLAALLSWESAYRVVGWKPYVFPAPSHVADAAAAMFGVTTRFGEELHAGWPWSPPGQAGAPAAPRKEPPVWQSPMVVAIGVSAVRLVVGFAIAAVLGVGLGLLMWRYRFVDSLLGPLFLGLQTLPSVCWVPLAVLTLGINERGILFVLVMGSFSAVAISLRDGLRNVPPLMRIAGLMLGARRYPLYRHVLLPSSMPALANTMRQGFAFAWRSLMGGELVLAVQRRGLGFLLNVGRDFADVAQVVAVMAAMVAIGMLVDRWVFATIERKVRTRFGLESAR
jgi:NitT/TauT family transport system permease protein